jgi:hypothetical protein
MITPSFSLTATERVLPKVALDFTAASLDPRVTFTRTGNTATVVNSSGLIQLVNADVPRFDYDPTTLACKGLLIEEQRINLIRYSEDFGNAVWAGSYAGRVTIATDTFTAPDGTLTADTITSTANNTARVQQTITVTAGVTYTFSLWIRRKTGTGVIRIGTNHEVATIDVTNQISSTSWTRVSHSNIPRVSTNGPAYTVIQMNTLGDEIYVWGAQLEAGAFLTSYIPNLATGTTTRNADVATMTGTNFSDWWQASKGSVLAKLQQNTVTGTRPIIQFDDNTADNIIALRGNTTNPELYIKNTTDQAQIDAGTIAANISYRLASSWNTNDCAASVNSGTPVLDGVATIPTVNQARIGSDGTNYLNGTIQSIEYYAERLLSSNLQVISSSSGYRSIIVPVVRDTIIS